MYHASFFDLNLFWVHEVLIFTLFFKMRSRAQSILHKRAFNSFTTSTSRISSTLSTSSTHFYNSSQFVSEREQTRSFSSEASKSDEEIIELVEKGEIQPHNLERALPNDLVRAVGIRRYPQFRSTFYGILNV
jgi:hypothetical protein